MPNNQISLGNPFGLNIALPKKTLEDVQKAAKKELENITLNPVLNYLEENDKVFSGQVAQEIKKYQAQIYSLGQVMRDESPHSTFNVNI